MRMVINFFKGKSLRKLITHTNLVLILKKDIVQIFLNFRTITLGNVVNKILTRIIHDGLERFLQEFSLPTNQELSSG